MSARKIVPEQFEVTYSERRNHKVPTLARANSMDIGFAFGKTPDELFAAFGPNAGAAGVAEIEPSSDMLMDFTVSALKRKLIHAGMRWISRRDWHSRSVWALRRTDVGS